MLCTKKKIRPGVVVFEINDSIRLGPTIQELNKNVEEAIKNDEKWIVMDFSRVTYMDSSGVGTVVRILGNLKKLGGTLRLSGVKGMVEGVLKLTQVVRIIEIFPTAEEATVGLPPEAPSQ